MVYYWKGPNVGLPDPQSLTRHVLIRVTPHSSAPTRDFADGPADFKVIFDTKHLISGVHLFLIGLNSHSFQAPSQFELWAEPVRSRAHPWRICIEMVSELATIQ